MWLLSTPAEFDSWWAYHYRGVVGSNPTNREMATLSIAQWESTRYFFSILSLNEKRRPHKSEDVGSRPAGCTSTRSSKVEQVAFNHLVGSSSLSGCTNACSLTDRILGYEPRDSGSNPDEYSSYYHLKR